MTDFSLSPYYQFNPTHFKTGTTNMTLEQTGAYIRLLNEQWLREGHLPADIDQLARMIDCSPTRFRRHIWPILKEKFEKSATNVEQISNKRLEKEREKMSKKAEINRQNAIKRWAKSLEDKGPPDAAALNPHMQADMRLDMPPDKRPQCEIEIEIEKENTLRGAAAPNDVVQDISEEAKVFRRGREVMGKNAGGLIAKLVKAIGLEDAAIKLEIAATKDRPSDWIGAVIKNNNPQLAKKPPFQM